MHPVELEAEQDLAYFIPLVVSRNAKLMVLLAFRVCGGDGWLYQCGAFTTIVARMNLILWALWDC